MSEPTPLTDALEEDLDELVTIRAIRQLALFRYQSLERTLAVQRTALLALAERIRREGMQGVANEIEEICK